jgi:hypothetical protein
MPFKSDKQARMMRAAAHDPTFAKKVGVPQKTAMKMVRDDMKARGVKSKSKSKK